MSSPNLSPIEPIWHELKKLIWGLPHPPNTTKQLIAAIHDAWDTHRISEDGGYVPNIFWSLRIWMCWRCLNDAEDFWRFAKLNRIVGNMYGVKVQEYWCRNRNMLKCRTTYIEQVHTHHWWWPLVRSSTYKGHARPTWRAPFESVVYSYLLESYDKHEHDKFSGFGDIPGLIFNIIKPLFHHEM